MIIGVDLGTSNIKAGTIVDGSFYSSKYGYNTYYQGDTVEQDPTDYLKGTIYCLKNLLAKIKSQEKPEAIVFSGHSPSLVPVDQQGKALSRAIIWQDKRAFKEAELINERLGFKINASFNEAKILWLKNNKPDLYNATYKFLQPKDFIIGCLTNRFLIDGSAASTMATYDRKQQDFALLQSLGLEIRKMPALVQSSFVIDGIVSEYADALGIDKGIKIVAGGIDAFCEALGCGVYDEKQMGEMTGTSTCVFSCSEQAQYADYEPPYHVIEGKHLNVLPLSCSGGTIEWFITRILEKRMAPNILKEFNDSLLTTPPASNLIFIPYIMGARSPYWDDSAKGCFIGLNKDDSIRTMYRSVLEGLAFDLRQNIELLDEKEEISRVYTTGGGSKNEGWLQIKADVCNRVFCRTKYNDGAILGDVILGESSIGKRDIKSSIEEYVIVEKAFTPRKEYVDKYNETYSIFKNVYNHLKTDFQLLIK